VHTEESSTNVAGVRFRSRPDGAGNVVFDGEAEAFGYKPFKTLAEIEAQRAKLEALLAERRKAIRMPGLARMAS
jgi:hypothetical protein